MTGTQMGQAMGNEGGVLWLGLLLGSVLAPIPTECVMLRRILELKLVRPSHSSSHMRCQSTGKQA